MNLNILGLSEVRWTKTGSEEIGNRRMIWSGGDSQKNGVVILLDDTTAKSLKGIYPIWDRVMVIKLKSTPLDMGIIQVYAPTTRQDEMEVQGFYEDLDKAMKYLKSQDIKVVMGDFNAKVGDKRIEDIVGPWGLGVENERGERLIEWCRENHFMISNTWFQNPQRRQ